MITGLMSTPVIQCLQDSRFRLQLTGSRFFDPHKQYTDATDYDFFVECGADVIAWLKGIGFKELSASYGGGTGYNDQEIVCIYRRKTAFGPQVDVQLVRDFRVKEAANSMLKIALGHYMNVIPKEVRGKLWNLAIKAAQ